MKINYHFHSRCSFDAEYPLTEMCAAARSAGLKYLCLTDHCDLMDEYGKPWDGFSWPDVDAELRAARQQFPALDIRRGIELGQAAERPDAAQKILSDPEIDFVLGSQHNLPGGQDFYWIHCCNRRQGQAMLEEYLSCLLALSRTDWFDSLAHLTYPIRYLKYRDGLDVDFRPFDDLVEAILKTLIARGKALELNTSGWRDGLGEPLPPESVLKRYRDLGGELLTVGTDAHEPKYMADGLDRAGALLRKLGFRWITLYKNRKPQQIKLEELL